MLIKILIKKVCLDHCIEIMAQCFSLFVSVIKNKYCIRNTILTKIFTQIALYHPVIIVRNSGDLYFIVELVFAILERRAAR